MEKKLVFTPFNRYEANVNWYMTASSEYRFENRYNLNPKDYNTTEKEIDWYLDAINKAQSENTKFILQLKKRISVIISIVVIFLSFVLEKVFNSDPYWYLGAIVSSIVFTTLILSFFIWGNGGFHKWLKSINRDMFFPPIMPNVECFLSEYQRRKEEYYAEKTKNLR